MQTLKEGYDADLGNLQVQTNWIKNEPCPPRNGPSQNLAGMINDDPAMASVAIRGCSYMPNQEPAPLVQTSADLIKIYGARVSGEIQRLRVNPSYHHRQSIAKPSPLIADRCWCGS